jgi:glycosyltransferase involved in cell wall biosynthesis
VKITTRRIDYPIGRSPWRGGRYRSLVDHVVANCESVRRRVLDAGVDPSRVTLIHEGIDPEPWLALTSHREEARDRLGLPREATVVCCAASLRPRKGQRILIGAFARLADRFPEAILVLAGEGTERDRLATMAEERGLADRVRIPGAIRPVGDLYAASDVGVMASFHEGLSNACLEQAAAGLPLVVSDVGGLPEIVDDGVTGFVAEPGDVGGFEDRIGRLLEDPDLRREAGEAGRRRILELFTAERMARRTEELWTRLCEDHRARQPSP